MPRNYPLRNRQKAEKAFKKKLQLVSDQNDKDSQKQETHPSDELNKKNIVLVPDSQQEPPTVFMSFLFLNFNTFTKN
jgi:hypothetical protein